MMDPTKLASTYDRPQALAHAMLQLAPDPSPEFWQCISEPVLSVLLYTASPGQRGGGLGWVNDAVTTLAVDNGDAAGAVGISDPAASGFLSMLDGLNDPQRSSIIATLRQAVTPWLTTSRVG